MRRLPGPFPTFELEEWEPPVQLEGLGLSARDRLLAEALGEADRRLIVEEMRDGLRIRSTSWIGLVRFEGFEIRVVPKLVGGNLGVVEMLDYASGLGALARYPNVRDLAAERDGSLVDLLALLLAEATDHIVRDGVLSDYVTREDTLGVLRGRLLIADQVRRHFGQVDRLACRYDEFETDIVENRLLAVAFSLARGVVSNADVRRRVVRLANVLAEVCDPGAFEADAAEQELTYHRRNEHYRNAHTLAWFFVRRLAVRDLYAPGGGRSFAFLLDMNRLFEDFVTRLLGDLFVASDVRVIAQRRDRSLIFNEATLRPYAAVIPDVVLERGPAGDRRQIPVDAKYKLYDERRLDPADIYQTFFYGYAYARAQEHADGKAVAYLIYPATGGAAPVQLRVQRSDGMTSARIRTIGLDVPATLAAIRDGDQGVPPALTGIRAAMLPPVAATPA